LADIEAMLSSAEACAAGGGVAASDDDDRGRARGKTVTALDE
jgi:hypothetical protein